VPGQPSPDPWNIARWLTVAALAGSHCGAFAQKIDFAEQVQPILAEKCYVCHGPVQQQGGLRMDRRESRSIALVKGSGGVTEFLRRISSEDPAVRMPPWPVSLGLSTEQIQTLKTWVSEGATGEDLAPLPPEVADLFTTVDNEHTALLRRSYGITNY
jgi:hypothetical protein